MHTKIWLSAPHQTGKEHAYLQEVLDQNWLAPNGRQVKIFEANLAKYIASAHLPPVVVMTASGTSAIHLALRLLGVQKGDLVLCQTLTFVGSVNPIVYLGATPVFVDSELLSWNMCPRALEKAIQHCLAHSKKPKAIVVVDLYGNPADWNALKSIASHYEIPILEDAAEALGSTYEGVKAGLWGDVGIYSFNGNKIITATSGGALITTCVENEQKVRLWINQSREQTSHYEHRELGYNYQMSDLCGAVGRAQLECIESRVEARRRIFSNYKTVLQYLVQFQKELPEAYSNRWLTSILFENAAQRQAVEQICAKSSIDCRRIWKPMHQQPLFQGNLYFGERNADYLFDHGLCLPSSSNLTDQQLTYIKENILTCFS